MFLRVIAGSLPTFRVMHGLVTAAFLYSAASAQHIPEREREDRDKKKEKERRRNEGREVEIKGENKRGLKSKAVCCVES